ncbi:hypothetical protein [Kaarinaea lacus]
MSNNLIRQNHHCLTFIGAVCMVLALILSQPWSVARAAVIPQAYDVVALPYQPVVGNFNAFTAINNNGLAVGYGNRNTRSMGFVFDYREQEVIALIDDFIPMSINDYNKIAGIYAMPNGNATLATCVLSNKTCDVSPIEGAEFALPFTATALTNSGMLAAKQWLNTPDEQFLLYRNGQLIYNALTDPDANGVSLAYYDIQRNNTRLIAGAISEPMGLQTPMLNIINPDLSVTALKLPVPGLDGGAGYGAAVAVNGLNQLVISSMNGSDQGQLYLCEFIGDVDNDGLGDCQHGLEFLGPNANPNYPYARYPLNDRGLLVTPPAYQGDEIHLYDLTADQPMAERLSSKGYKASIFASTQPLAVNDEQVILVSGAQTVLLVPEVPAPDITMQIQSGLGEPIVAVADGSERLYLTESITNHTSRSQTLLYWRVLLMPDGTAYPRSTPKRLILEAGNAFSDNRVRLRLPAYFPPGNYVYQSIAINESSGERYIDEVQIIKLPE